jgi:hypothetical protein
LKKLLKNNQHSNFPIKGENWEDEGNSFFNLKDCENTFPMGIQDPNPKTCTFHYKRKIKVVIVKIIKLKHKKEARILNNISIMSS